ncbi:MAG TPA: transposase, partial [Streptosporangiaceae bacterium]|nr:transposase [Streptosporangiaceae bacterium]
MDEVSDEPLYRDRVCGIDIGKAGMVATIRVPSDKNPARRAAETRSFGTAKREVLALADWLRCWQVPAVVMEATGDYWKGPFYRLEAGGFECVLAGAKQVKHLPGRPERDPSDSRWLAACFERGAVTSCFVATPEFRVIRLHTRYRRDLTGERTREKQRAEKLPESAAVKLSSVVTGLHGVTGRDIMDHLIAGERNPRVLAQLARARARRKISELEAALDGAGFFTPEHAALLAAMLARIDRVNEEITRLTEVIERLLEPYEEQLQQAESMPGWGRRAAGDAVAGTGTGMTRFPCRRAPGLLGRPHPAGQLLRQAHRPGQIQERQPGPRRPARRDRRRGRQNPDPRRRPLPAAGPPPRQSQSPGRRREHPAEGLPQAAVQPRHALSGPRRGLLRAPARPPPADQPPRRQARRPRLRSHPLPPPRTRTRRSGPCPGRLTTPRTHRRAKDPAPPALPRARLGCCFRV